MANERETEAVRRREGHIDARVEDLGKQVSKPLKEHLDG